MNYKVLYRKYRPDNFENLVGQDNIVKILKNSIITKKISHAYILSGPRGTGKTSTAKIFAKNINCLEPIDGSACNKCINCSNFQSTSDIIEIDAASNNGVDEIREITSNIKLVPSLLKYKVYIIDEVHMLSTSAFNALLLTLEEPPKHVVFILATTNIESIPITVLSRCQRFDFKKINNIDICNRLKKISELENINITEKAILQIAQLSDGGLRDSLSLLDQISKENEKIDEEDVLNYSGIVSEKILESIIQLVEENKCLELEEKLKEIFNMNIDYKVFLKNLITTIAKKVRDIVIIDKVSSIDINMYKSLMYDLTKIQNNININVDVYSIVLVTLFSYMKIEETAVTIKEKSRNIEKQEIKKSIAIDNQCDKNEKLKEIRINNCFSKANKEEKIKIIEIWDNYIKKSVSNLKGFLVDAEIAMASEDIITIFVERENDLEELKKNYEYLLNDFLNITKVKRKIVLVSKVEWNKLVIKYKNDIKSGIIYTVKDESSYQSNNNVDIVDIFDVNKIKEED